MAEVRKLGNVTVNDGKGLFDNEGLIDSMIVDCNSAVQQLASGQAIQFCNIMVQMVCKLRNLKDGVKNDLQNRDDTIKVLKEEIEIMQTAQEISKEKDGGTRE